MNKRGLILIIFLVVIIFIGSYFLFFKTKSCDTVGCFEKAAAECKKARIYTEEGKGTVTLYNIRGKEGDNCELYVKIVEVDEELDPETASSFKDKDMTCMIPTNKFSRMKMEEMGSDLDYCTGRLKEEMYSVLVKKLYKLVLDDLGLVLEEVERLIG